MAFIEYLIIVTIVLGLAISIRKFIRGSLSKDLIRVTLFFLPFLVAVFYYGIPEFSLGDQIIQSYSIAIGTSLIAILVQIKNFKPYLNRSFYFFVPITKMRFLYSMQVSLLLSPVFEELLYRYYFPQLNNFIDPLLSGLLFSAVHFLNKFTRDDFTFKDYLILFLLGISWYISYSISGSIVPAIMGHLIYNLPNSIISLLRYVIPKQKEQNNSVKG